MQMRQGRWDEASNDPEAAARSMSRSASDSPKASVAQQNPPTNGEPRPLETPEVSSQSQKDLQREAAALLPFAYDR